MWLGCTIRWSARILGKFQNLHPKFSSFITVALFEQNTTARKFAISITGIVPLTTFAPTCTKLDFVSWSFFSCSCSRKSVPEWVSTSLTCVKWVEPAGPYLWFEWPEAEKHSWSNLLHLHLLTISAFLCPSDLGSMIIAEWNDYGMTKF